MGKCIRAEKSASRGGGHRPPPPKADQHSKRLPLSGWEHYNKIASANCCYGIRVLLIVPPIPVSLGRIRRPPVASGSLHGCPRLEGRCRPGSHLPYIPCGPEVPALSSRGSRDKDPGETTKHRSSRRPRAGPRTPYGRPSGRSWSTARYRRGVQVQGTAPVDPALQGQANSHQVKKLDSCDHFDAP